VFRTLITAALAAFAALSRDRVVMELPVGGGAGVANAVSDSGNVKMTPDQVRGGQWGGVVLNRQLGTTWKVRPGSPDQARG
jgi:hypothetical protein